MRRDRVTHAVHRGLARLAAAVLLVQCASVATAAGAVVRMPASGGEVLLPTPRDVELHDTWRLATARRVGDTLYVSGVVIAPRDGEGTDVDAFKAQARRGFERLRATLAAAGATSPTWR